MWMIFGLSAIAAAVLNLLFWSKGKDPKWFRFLSLALTALTLCAEYQMVEDWVLREDWSALMDVVPTMTKSLWFLVGGSIAVNAITLLPKK